MSILKQYTIDGGYIDRRKGRDCVFILFLSFGINENRIKSWDCQKKYKIKMKRS